MIALEISKYPAPGQYESNMMNKPKAPRCSTSQSKRKTFMDDMQRNSTPGPGQHDVKLSSAKNRSASAFFGKSNRKPLDENEKTPGPFGYENNRLNFLNSSPQYSSTKSVAKNELYGKNP